MDLRIPLDRHHVIIHKSTQEDYTAQQPPSFIRNGALGRSTFEAASNAAPAPKRRKRKQKRMSPEPQHDPNPGHPPVPGSSRNIISRGTPVSFRTLPREIRDLVYAELVGICPAKPYVIRAKCDQSRWVPVPPPPNKFRPLETNILRLNKQISQEAAMVLYQGNRWIYVCLHARTTPWVDRFKEMVGRRYKYDVTTAQKQAMKVLFAARISEELDCSEICKKSALLGFQEIVRRPSEPDAVSEIQKVTEQMVTRASQIVHRDNKQLKEDFLIPIEGADDLIQAILDLVRPKEHTSRAPNPHMHVEVTTGKVDITVGNDPFTVKKDDMDYIAVGKDGLTAKKDGLTTRKVDRTIGYYSGRDLTIRDEIVTRFRQIRLFDQVKYQGMKPDMWKPFSSPQEATAALQSFMDKARVFFRAGQWAETISAYTTAHAHFLTLYRICRTSKKLCGGFKSKSGSQMVPFYTFLSLEGECDISRSWAALQLGSHSSQVDYKSALTWAVLAMKSPFLGSEHLLKCYTAKSLALAGLDADKKALQAFECMRFRLERMLPEGKLRALDKFVQYGGLEFEMGPWKWQKRRYTLRQYKVRQFWKAWKLLWQPVTDFEADPVKHATYNMAGPHGRWGFVPWHIPVRQGRLRLDGPDHYFYHATFGDLVEVGIEELKRNEALMLDLVFSPPTQM